MAKIIFTCVADPHAVAAPQGPGRSAGEARAVAAETTRAVKERAGIVGA